MDMVKYTLIEKDRLLAVDEGLMGFFLDKVINPSRKHYYDRYSIEELA
jgi:hypothetical protein